jgi:hypothetical protein
MILKSYVQHVMQLWPSFTPATQTLKTTYFAYFYSVTKYALIVCNNSGGGGGNLSHSQKVLMLQKKIFRIRVGAKPGNPCRGVEILLLYCEYIFL